MDTTAPITGGSDARGAPNLKNSVHHQGREQVPWGPEVWERIEKTVHDEVIRTRIGAQFLPISRVHFKTLAVPSNSFTTVPPGGSATSSPVLNISETASTPLNEFYVEFLMTSTQVEHETGRVDEPGNSTAATLAARAASLLAQAEDSVIFNGCNAASLPPFSNDLAAFRTRPVDSGLLNLNPSLAAPALQVVAVQAKTQNVYGENTIGAVALAISLLQAAGHYGPYAVVLSTTPYADAFAPLANTLILPADRIKPLATAGFFGTGVLPVATQNPPLTSYDLKGVDPIVSFFPATLADGSTVPALPTGASAGKSGYTVAFFGGVFSLGGNTMDLVAGLDAMATVAQAEPSKYCRFRVVERFALRLQDPTAAVRLEFLQA